MRLRTMIGFGIGYALGARSDTQKFDNMSELAKSVMQSPIFQALVQQARQTAASGVQSLTGQQPAWGGAGNGAQAPARQGGQQQTEQAQSDQGQQAGSQESESAESEKSEESQAGGQKQKQQASTSSS